MIGEIIAYFVGRSDGRDDERRKYNRYERHEQPQPQPPQQNNRLTHDDVVWGRFSAFLFIVCLVIIAIVTLFSS